MNLARSLTIIAVILVTSQYSAANALPTSDSSAAPPVSVEEDPVLVNEAIEAGESLDPGQEVVDELMEMAPGPIMDLHSVSGSLTPLAPGLTGVQEHIEDQLFLLSPDGSMEPFATVARDERLILANVVPVDELDQVPESELVAQSEDSEMPCSKAKSAISDSDNAHANSVQQMGESLLYHNVILSMFVAFISALFLTLAVGRLLVALFSSRKGYEQVPTVIVSQAPPAFIEKQRL